MNNLIFINGSSHKITDEHIDKISMDNVLFNDINDGLILIDKDDIAKRWKFLNKYIMSSDIIDISNVYPKIKQQRRISKINDILK